jgi:hypothetical protein
MEIETSPQARSSGSESGILTNNSDANFPLFWTETRVQGRHTSLSKHAGIAVNFHTCIMKLLDSIVVTSIYSDIIIDKHVTVVQS